MADKDEDIKADDVPEKDDKKVEKKPEPKKKSKADKEDEVLVKNSIEINPKLEEAKGDTVVLGWGRMNPITSGHEKLVNKINDVARKESGKPVIYLTHSQDPKKNPLSYNDKVMLAKKAFGNAIQKSKAKTIMQALGELEKKFTKVILVVGADRIKEFETLLNKYNGKDYSFDSIKVVSAGSRADPDSEEAKSLSADSMSASVMRKLASEGDFESFKKGLPKKLGRNAKDVYDMVRAGMKIAEEMELDEAVLSLQQRRQRALTMRRYKSKLSAARKRMAKRVSSKAKLQKKARKKAIALIRKKVAGAKGGSYSSLNPAEKMQIDKRVAKRKGAIDRIAKKMLPVVRKADIARVAGRKVNEEFENLFEVAQDADIKDKKGTQPAKYHAGLSKSTKDKRDAHFKKGAKMDDDNDAAYKPAPGDAEAKTKPSTHTKRYHQMFNKEGKIKTDGRFRAFRKKVTEDAEQRLRDQHKKEKEDQSSEHEREMDSVKARKMRTQIRDLKKEENEQILEWITDIADEIFDSIELEESKGDAGLKAKAEKSGMPLGVLRQVYNRGIAAWRTGHRPGTTPQQWGFARVNSFITKQSGTWGKADKDLADKVRGSSKKESVEEGAVSAAQRAAIAISKKAKAGKPGYDSEGKSLKEDDPCWDSHEQRGMKKKNGKLVPNCVPKNEGAEVYVVKKGPYQRKVDGATADRMKKQGWRIVARESVEERSAEDIMFEEHLKSSGADPRLFTERSTQDIIKAKIGSIANKKNYQHAMKTLITVLDRKKKESKGKIRHSVGYYAAQIAKTYAGVDGRTLADMVPSNYVFEQGGAGDRGTEKVTKRYKKDTPGETVTESVDDLFEAYFEEEVTQKQLNDLERFADRLLDKFGIDVEFTRHFADRMNDDRNKPAITIAELQRVFKKIAKNKAKNIRQNPDIEAVLKDIQADLNLPIVINYDSEKDEYEVVNKTIMRKKNFGTSSKVIKV